MASQIPGSTLPRSSEVASRAYRRRSLRRSSLLGALFAAGLVLAAPEAARADRILLLSCFSGADTYPIFASANTALSPIHTVTYAPYTASLGATITPANYDRVYFIGLPQSGVPCGAFSAVQSFIAAGGDAVWAVEFGSGFGGYPEMAAMFDAVTTIDGITPVARTVSGTGAGEIAEPATWVSGAPGACAGAPLPRYPTAASGHFAGAPVDAYATRFDLSGQPAALYFDERTLVPGAGRIFAMADTSAALPSATWREIDRFLAGVIGYGTDECVSCATVAACNDGNPCTTDTCSGAGLCSSTPVAAGTTCAGGVCNGAPAACVVCLDSATTGTDLGCSGSAPNCDGSGTADAVCQPCIDTVDGGPDLGCSGDLDFCLPFNDSAGINTCQQCEDALDCDDGDSCTIDSCRRFLFSPTIGVFQCQHTVAPVGTSCTGGVCNGEAGGCVPCLDDSLTSVDSGCNRTDQHCLGAGESASCELCVDTVASGTDLGCSAGLPFCVPVPPMGASTEVVFSCVECLSAANCNDGNECTVDGCSASGSCSTTALPAGSPCTGGVCNGDEALCVTCLDDSATSTDSGCSGAAPHCDATGTDSAACEPCLDTASGSVDLGCSDATPNCVEGGLGPNTCIACESAADCDDGNDCTTDSCAEGMCSNEALAAGTSCEGGVCNGADAECVGCFDGGSEGNDPGCTDAAAICDEGAAGGPTCVACQDTSVDGVDEGCTEALAFCDEGAAGGPACELCEDSTEAGTDRGCTDAEPSCEERDGARVCVPVPSGDDGGSPRLDGGVTEQPGLAGGALCSVQRGAGGSGAGGSGTGGVLTVLLAALGGLVARRRRR